MADFECDGIQTEIFELNACLWRESNLFPLTLDDNGMFDHRVHFFGPPGLSCSLRLHCVKEFTLLFHINLSVESYLNSFRITVFDAHFSMLWRSCYEDIPHNYPQLELIDGKIRTRDGELSTYPGKNLFFLVEFDIQEENVNEESDEDTWEGYLYNWVCLRSLYSCQLWQLHWSMLQEWQCSFRHSCQTDEGKISPWENYIYTVLYIFVIF